MVPQYGSVPSSQRALKYEPLGSWGIPGVYKGPFFRAHTKGPCNYPKIIGVFIVLKSSGFA